MPVKRRMGENVWKNQSISDFSLSCSSVRNVAVWEFLLKGRKSRQSSKTRLLWVKHFCDLAFGELLCFRTQKGHGEYILYRVSFR